MVMVAKPLTVKEAREVAETAARVALEQLGVGATAPLTIDLRSENQKDLRRKLRIHGRQWGDGREGTTETQGIDRLKEEEEIFYWEPLKKARDARRW